MIYLGIVIIQIGSTFLLGVEKLGIKMVVIPEPCKELRRRISAAIYGWDYSLLTFIYPGCDCGSISFGLRGAGCRLRVAGCGLGVRGLGVWGFGGWGLGVGGWGLGVGGWGG